MPAILEDVVALVQCTDAVANAKAAITARIEKNGGRVAARLGKEVSHIVWERRHSRRPSDKAADEAELMELFRKLEKMDYPPVVVSPLWVEESIKAGRRLVERKYLVKKPTESLLGRTPGSGAGAAAKKRKRPAAAVLPKPPEAYELDDLVFSSTQQMHNDLAGPPDDAAGEVCSPRGGKQPRRGAAGGRGTAGKQQRGGRGGRSAAAAMPAVAEEEEEQEEAAEAVQEGRAPGVGSDTQAVANILTIDLPDDEPGHTPGPAGEEEDELDTPLALRFAKSSAERAAAWGSGGSSGGRAAGSGAPRGGGGGPAGAAAADRRSRLALASGPREQEPEVAGDQDAIEEADSDGEQAAMQVDGPTAAQQEQQVGEDQQPPGQQQQQQQQEEADGGEQRAREAATVKGVAARFSVRQLVQHPERPVLVHKGTPLPGALPSPGDSDKTGKGPIPIPVVERVTSPWALAEQVPATQPTQSQATQQPEAAAPGAGAAGEAAAGRPSMGGLPPRSGRRGSLLAVSNVRRASGATPGAAAAENGATPGSAARPTPVNPNPTGQEGKLPTPWSTLRPWDGKPASQGAPAAADGGQAEDAVSAGSGDENQAGPPQQQAAAQQAEPEDGKQQQGGKARARAAGGSSSGTRRAARHAAAEVAEAVDSDAPGPTQGCIALTSVDPAVVDLARSATRRLRGLRLCPEGREEGQITHLVIGDERRTLKLMLAVANGAWLVSPQWVTASLEAGRWLPESQFPAKVRFEESAARARALLESPDAAPLLAEHSIYVHLPDKARKLMGANAAALKRVAAVLGAKVVPPKACSLCVVVGGGSRPPGLPRGARCLREEWLFHAAERFEQPAMEEYEL